MIIFDKDSTNVCTITGSNTDGTCVFDGSYIAYYIYTCNPTTDTYTVTIPGSYLTDSLHGTTWRCEDPFGGGGSSTKILYGTISITTSNGTYSRTISAESYISMRSNTCEGKI
jgi:hypothetical protein